ncbi:peptidylprolyl isomerase, partial [Rhodococcus sp. NPDC058514]
MSRTRAFLAAIACAALAAGCSDSPAESAGQAQPTTTEATTTAPAPKGDERGSLIHEPPLPPTPAP